MHFHHSAQLFLLGELPLIEEVPTEVPLLEVPLNRYSEVPLEVP